MRRLKVCFVGVGSIATRHIKNLRYVCNERNIELSVDAVRRVDSKPLAKELGVDKVYLDNDDIPADYDVLFITNPTSMHMDVLEKYHNNAKHFFIEKPISSLDEIDRVTHFPYRANATYYVACPMRYFGVMQYLKSNVDMTKVISARSVCSSYLPEWRPGTDYRECYSAHKSMGGGVSIDLIHEWDYLTDLFGMPDSVIGKMGKISSLEIDSEDYALYIGQYKDKIVELHLDYFGRQSIRELMLITDEETIIADFIGKTVRFCKAGAVLDFAEERDDGCRRELAHFLDIIDGIIESDNTPEHAAEVMKISQI